MPKISIIVPIYNVEKYLNRCIDSILNQTFVDFELILVDDGSHDNCGAICDEYVKKDKRIKVIHKENGGLSSARNAGIDIAQGEYLGFVDSDDWIHPQLLELSFSIIKKTEVDIVSFDYIKIQKEKYNCEKINIEKEAANAKIYEKEFIINNLYNKFQQQIGVEAWKKIYKADIFKDLRFRKGIIHEDDDIFLDILFKVKKIAITNNVLYFYYMSNTSIMRSGFSEKELIRLDIDMKNIRRINMEEIISQKKLCSIPYFEHYMGFYYLIYEKEQQYIALFKRYKKENFQNILYILKNRNISKAFLVLALLFWISPKLAKRLYNKLI